MRLYGVKAAMSGAGGGVGAWWRVWCAVWRGLVAVSCVNGLVWCKTMRVSYRGGVGLRPMLMPDWLSALFFWNIAPDGEVCYWPFLIIQRYGDWCGICKFVLRNFAFYFYYLLGVWWRE